MANSPAEMSPQKWCFYSKEFLHGLPVVVPVYQYILGNILYSDIDKNNGE